MEITIAILAYLFHCFTAFALIFSYDKAKIRGDMKDEEIPTQHIPRLDDLQEEKMLFPCDDDTKEEKEHKQRVNEIIERKNKEQRQKYVDEVIKPYTLYISLLKEIDYYQSQYRHSSPQFIIQIFSLLLCSQMLIRMETFESWLVTILVVATICAVSCFIIYWIYNNYWRCRKIRIEHFYTGNGYIIDRHHEYLYSIKETVYFRYSIRKIFESTSLIILLLFMPIPE